MVEEINELSPRIIRNLRKRVLKAVLLDKKWLTGYDGDTRIVQLISTKNNRVYYETSMQVLQDTFGKDTEKIVRE